MGKGSSAPTEQTVTQTNIPEEFMPYFERLMGRVEAESLQPYQAYTGDRLMDSGDYADITAARDATRALAAAGTPAGITDAQNMTRDVASGAAGLAALQQPYQFSEYGGFKAGTASPYSSFSATQASPFSDFSTSKGSEFRGFTEGSVNPFTNFIETKGKEFTDFSAGKATPYAEFAAGTAQPFSDFSEAGYQQFGFGPAGEFSAENISKYMNPYAQNVVNVEKQQAQEDYDIARQGRSSRAVSAGAFGGSRAAVQEGLAERDLLQRQGDIQAKGLSTAYSDAQRLFEADRAARMETEKAQAGEGARVQSGLAGEAARVQAARAAELARTQGINIDEAARVQQAEAAEIARTQGINIDEATRVQQARAAEAARVQGMSQEEAARVQGAQAAELARVQGIGIDEAARVQQAKAAEAARVQGIDVDEAARVQQARAAELARVQGISVEEAARIQAAEAAELARTQGITIDEAARIQAGQAAEAARVQGAQASENLASNQFGLSALELQAQQAAQLAGLTAQEREAAIQNAQLMESIGSAQMAEDQAQADLDYQDYLRQQGYTEEQLGFYSDILRGLPVADASTTTATNSVYTNPLQQALGAGLSGVSLYKAFQ